MLVKSTPGVDFINVLQTAFTRPDPKRAKKIVKLKVFFALLGSAQIKGACKTLVKLTLDLRFLIILNVQSGSTIAANFLPSSLFVFLLSRFFR